MGASLSRLTEGDEGPNSIRTGLGDIPESCVASVFMYLSPPEICKLARVNRAFRGAASADFVWESKLPSNYRELWQTLFSECPENLTKQEIYALLCRPVPFDGGSKEVWLEKTTGAVCLTISSRAMSITGIDDRRYWNWIPTDESRFHGVAYLQQIWWFEVDGEVEFCFPEGAYSLFFRVHLGKASKKLGRRVCNFEHIHGWDIKPVRFHLSTSDGQNASRDCYLEESNKNGSEWNKPYSRGAWLKCHVGDFRVNSSDSPTKIKYSMTQIDCTHTKGGLCVDSVFIVPVNLSERRKACSLLERGR
ncbi:hypothetical protein AMTRI_Chr09g22720 [Amborella trichopoda]|uniref:F-box domain-containing protein n=1 Tax=Amborella trichopoda TaxID=13333 RepID=U5DAU2_AMBTC|nr:F-box protein PP2-A15 [Amborella trichopoda]ERN19355.1 hypothetical protein AMTR_s00069p00115850 [Amborella trichopoda]|eukprot:XP_006857888.1 F-box protein PP2-A15 [Amborella trichopoda]